jgi:hypothetical protein
MRGPPVITSEQLRVYQKFDGDIDGWVRSTKANSPTMKDEDWTRIDTLLHRLRIVVSKQGSDDFCKQVLTEARDAADGEEVYEQLLKLATLSK